MSHADSLGAVSNPQLIENDETNLILTAAMKNGKGEDCQLTLKGEVSQEPGGQRLMYLAYPLVRDYEEVREGRGQGRFCSSLPPPQPPRLALCANR